MNPFLAVSKSHIPHKHLHPPNQLLYLYVVAAMLRGGPSSPSLSSSLTKGQFLRGRLPQNDGRVHRSDVPALPDVRGVIRLPCLLGRLASVPCLTD